MRLTAKTYATRPQAEPRAPSPPRAPAATPQNPQAGPTTAQRAQPPAATQVWMSPTLRISPTEANAKRPVQGGSEIPAGPGPSSCVWRVEYHPVCKQIKFNNQIALSFAEKVAWRLQNPQNQAVHVVVAPPDVADQLASYQPAGNDPHWVSKDSAGKVTLTWLAVVRGGVTKVGIQGGTWIGPAGLYLFPNNARVQRFA